MSVLGVLLLLLAAMSGRPALAAPRYDRLEQRFATLSADVYNYAAGDDKTALSASGVHSLEQQTGALIDRGEVFRAITLINANLELIKDNVDQPAAAALVDRMLQYNAYGPARVIFRYAETFAAPYAVSAIAYPFAKYHYARGDWQRVIELLKEQTSELAAEDAHHGAVLIGAALQKLKKHREAFKYYERVPAESAYYPYAQLNLALAYIRQGWWTDARLALEQAIENRGDGEHDELTNRVYLVLGYMLLNEGFYRDARTAFRNIHLDSRYANRGLLGLGLSATGQEDFVGALNVLSTLKQKGAHDLPSDETRVLLPYVYEKLKQQMTASAGYNDAVEYYSQRIDVIDGLLKRGDFYEPGALPAPGDESLSIDGADIVIDNELPAGFLAALRELNRYKRHIRNHHLLRQISELHREYRRAYEDVVRGTLVRRRDHLASYLNQSRYGLARLYDQSESAQ